MKVYVQKVVVCLMVLGSGMSAAGAERGGEAFFEVRDVLVKSGATAAYGLPAIVVSGEGTALLFVNQRMGHSGDMGNVQNVVLLRSKDSGKSWEKEQMLVSGAGRSVFPSAAVADEQTGKVFLFYGMLPLVDKAGKALAEKWMVEHPEEVIELGGKVYVMESNDEGVTWSEAKDVTRDLQVERSKGPMGWQSGGAGVQLKYGEHKGRLVVPSRYWAENRFVWEDLSNMRNCVFYSDDHGKSWRPGGISCQGWVGESAIVELSNGAIYMSNRNHNPATAGIRSHDISYDGGVTFTEAGDDPELIDPICHAGMVRFNDPGEGNIVLFLNPAVRAETDRKWGKREKLTVRASFDDCRSWPVGRLVNVGPAGYSGIAVCPDGTILCAYERGEKNARTNMAVARFNLAWLMAGK